MATTIALRGNRTIPGREKDKPVAFLNPIIPSAPAIGTVITSDSYNRADTAAGVLGSTDAAAGGAVLAYLTMTDFQIATNAVRRNTGTGGNQNVTLEASTSRVKVSHTVPALPTAAAVVGPIARYNGTTYYYARVGATGEIELLVVNPTIVSLGMTTGLGFTAGDKISIVCAGSYIAALRNDVVCLVANDSSVSAGTQVGYRASNNAVLRVDSFLVENVL